MFKIQIHSPKFYPLPAHKKKTYRTFTRQCELSRSSLCVVFLCCLQNVDVSYAAILYLRPLFDKYSIEPLHTYQNN